MRPALTLVVAALGPALLACGGGGKGQEQTPTCARWQPPATTGPGDAGGHVPLAVGNRWVFGRSGTGAPPWTSWAVEAVTGTRPVLGRSASVIATSDLDTGAPLGEVLWALDGHGLADLGNDDPTDAVTPQLVPYYLLRFPLQVGDQFTSVTCTALDFGEDLDGDGKHERLDVRADVSVEAVEPVETALATFPAATRLQTRITATVRATGSTQSVTLESLETDWLVPGIGRVKQVLEAPVGSPAPADGLLGYRVGSALKGLVARRAITSGTLAPALPGEAVAIHAAPFEGGFLLASTAGGTRAVALRVKPGGPADAEPFTLLDPGNPSPAEVTSPALAPRGSGVLAVTASWTGTGGDVRVQRIDAAGALLDGVGGRVLATAALGNPGFGGGPWVASDGSGFLVVWCEPDRLQAIRLDASGQPAGPAQTLAGPTSVYSGPGSAAVTFDGSRYLVLYQWLGDASGEQLRALHVQTDGAVVEASPLVISREPGVKRVLSALFDGVQHVLLMLDGRDPLGAAVTLRRLDPAGAFLDGDAATGGLVLTDAPAPIGMAFDGTHTFVTWVTGDAVRLARVTQAGALLDEQGGRPGVVAVDSDPLPRATLGAPTPLPTGDGALELLYLARDSLTGPGGPATLRGVLVGP